MAGTALGPCSKPRRQFAKCHHHRKIAAEESVAHDLRDLFRLKFLILVLTTGQAGRGGAGRGRPGPAGPGRVMTDEAGLGHGWGRGV